MPVDWHSAFVRQGVYKVRETEYQERENLMTWGQVIDIHFGEVNAKAALKCGDALPRMITTKSGEKKTLYAIFSATRSRGNYLGGDKGVYTRMATANPANQYRHCRPREKEMERYIERDGTGGNGLRDRKRERDKEARNVY